jgi:hypothetical protein
MSDMENEVMMDGIDDGPILPDGWTEDMDIFADEEPSILDSLADDAPDTTPAEETEAPTTEQPAAEAEGEATGEEAPTTEPETQETLVNNKLRFRAKVDHNDIDVELDEADLPTIYQKAQATDRAQNKLGAYSKTVDYANKLAASMGYANADEMLNAAAENYRNSMLQELLDSGTPQRIAEDYVNRHMAGMDTPLGGQPVDAQTPDPAPVATPPQRDYTAEAGELLSIRPQLRNQQLPDEVIQMVAAGKTMKDAYLEYEAKQQTAETERLRKENQILKQNAEAAARAPVAGTSGGGSTDQKAEDPFIVGFNSDYY